MTKEASEQLKVGDKVLWQNNHKDTGEVIEIGYASIKIKWNEANQIGVVDRRGLHDVTFP